MLATKPPPAPAVVRRSRARKSKHTQRGLRETIRDGFTNHAVSCPFPPFLWHFLSPRPIAGVRLRGRADRGGMLCWRTGRERERGCGIKSDHPISDFGRDRTTSFLLRPQTVLQTNIVSNASVHEHPSPEPSSSTTSLTSSPFARPSNPPKPDMGAAGSHISSKFARDSTKALSSSCPMAVGAIHRIQIQLT